MSQIQMLQKSLWFAENYSRTFRKALSGHFAVDELLSIPAPLRLQGLLSFAAPQLRGLDLTTSGRWLLVMAPLRLASVGLALFFTSSTLLVPKLRLYGVARLALLLPRPTVTLFRSPAPP